MLQETMAFFDSQQKLQPKEWIALGALIFTMFSFAVTQWYSIRSKKLERRLASRTYFDISYINRVIPLSSEKQLGVDPGLLLNTDDFKELIKINKQEGSINGEKVNKLRYMKIYNLGPSFALDCHIKVDCESGNDEEEFWTVNAYMKLVNTGTTLIYPFR